MPADARVTGETVTSDPPDLPLLLFKIKYGVLFAYGQVTCREQLRDIQTLREQSQALHEQQQRLSEQLQRNGEHLEAVGRRLARAKGGA